MPLPHDVRYVVDSSIELLEITPDLVSWLTIAEPNIDWNLVMDMPDAISYLTDEMLKWWQTASIEKRSVIVSDVMSSNTIHDQLYYRRTNIAYKSAVQFIEKTMGLSNISNLINDNRWEYFTDKKFPEYKKYRKLTKKEIASFISEPFVIQDKIRKWDAQFIDMVARFRETMTVFSSYRQYINVVKNHYPKTIMFDNKPTNKSVAQKVLKRSIRGVKTIIGSDMLDAFLCFQEVRFTGRKHLFGIKRTHISLLDNADHPDQFDHIPYELRLYDMTGMLMSYGCVYFDSTPILDQITALYLAIQAGMEDEIISVANWEHHTNLMHRPPSTIWYDLKDASPTKQISARNRLVKQHGKLMDMIAKPIAQKCSLPSIHTMNVFFQK